MKKISELILGYSDAENYKRRENKDLFNDLFIQNDHLNKLCQPSTTFLVGDKGMGKTAYSVFMVNNAFRDNISTLRYIRETEYQKFVTLKKEKNLDLSDYVAIWKVIIYFLLSEDICKNEGGTAFFSKFLKFKALNDAIREYYKHAFSPEIQYALQFVKESKIAAELLSKHAEASGELKDSVTFSESRFQTNLLYIQKNFESALNSLKLKRTHILFIDGIDIRPASIPYEDYMECIKGLANAVWEINNDFFPRIRDSPGRLRTILLIRPDIFASLGLQNQNTKIRDNAALLNWSTTYRDYRTSDLFAVADRLLAYQQKTSTSLQKGDAWDYYFPWDSPTENDRSIEFEKRSAFISFLRFALYRPRDIITMLTMLQERFMGTEKDQARAFSEADFDDSTFRRNYADYLLGEVKDQVSFYYSDKDYESFLRFFQFLDGKNKFTYEDYIRAYGKYVDYMNSAKIQRPKFMSSAEEFIQFLYELNVISYIEKTADYKTFIHWCFKDRTYSNISPKIKFSVEYEIFYGMSKALNTGKQFKSSTDGPNTRRNR